MLKNEIIVKLKSRDENNEEIRYIMMCCLSNIHTVAVSIYCSHCLQAIPVANTSLTMDLKLGYESEFSHLQMNPDPFP